MCDEDQNKSSMELVPKEETEHEVEADEEEQAAALPAKEDQPDGEVAQADPDEECAEKEAEAAAVEEAQLEELACEDSIFDLPEHVRVDFGSVFSEPKSYRKQRLTDKVTSGINWFLDNTYSWVMTFVYNLFALVLGFVMSLVWGVAFGTLNAIVVWLLQPFWKLFFIVLRSLTTPLRPCVRLTCDPLYESCGRCLGGMKGDFTVSVPELGHTHEV